MDAEPAIFGSGGPPRFPRYHGFYSPTACWRGSALEATGLLVNLTFALAMAAVGAAVAVRLGQSPIVGYIVAGIAIGPFTPGFVGDPEVVGSLADIGVIFLMFAIGAQISLPDLKRVGPVSVVGGLVQVGLTIAIGAGIGLLLGWDPVAALFFGAVISNSSSTVLTKVLGERGELGTEHGYISLGWSTVQDLSTIALIVILTALAGADATPASLLLAIGQAVLFLVILLPVGSRLVPRLVEFLASFKSREIFSLGVLSLALGTAYAGSLFGISVALAAFLAGVLVAESDLSHQVVGDAIPFRDVFAGVFFVSVGMLVDPQFVLANLPLVLLVLVLIVAVKGVIVSLLTLAFGYPGRTAILTGVALAQSAEFSFLLARVGSDAGAVDSTLFSLMLAGAAGSIVLAPLLHRGATPALQAIDRRWPDPPPPPLVDAPRRRAVVCGYGRVGRLVVAALGRRGITSVVVELDSRAARAAADDGHDVVRGSVENAVVLASALGAGATVLVIAVPDPLAARTAVAAARASHPRLPIVVRTHSTAERSVLRRLGASAVVVGELELGLEITRFAVRQFGVSGREAELLVAGLRNR